MIKKIVRIKDYRIFQEWQGGDSSSDFSKINLIYGVNGSGKSTIASILANAKSDENWKSGLCLSMQDESNETIEVTSHDHKFWNSVRVFDSRFIEDNLQFDSDGQSLAQPLLRIGKENIERDKEIKNLESRKVEITSLRSKSKDSHTKLTQLQEKLTRETADLIGGELSILGGRYKLRSYTALQVKQLLEQALIGVDPKKIAENLEMINSPRFGLCMIPDTSFFSTQDVSNKVQEVNSRTATSIVIKSLLEDSEKAAWVQKGLDWHKSHDECAFCGNSVTEERMTHLNEHFNESFRHLQADIEGTVQSISVLRASVMRIKNIVPALADMLPELRDEYQIELELFQNGIVAFHERLDFLNKILDSKKANLFEQVGIPALVQNEVVIDISDLIKIVLDHNDRVPSMDSLINERAQQVEHTRILSIQDEFKKNSSESIELDLELNSLIDEADLIDIDLARLNQEGRDPISLAEELNLELAEMLGRDELVFKFLKEGQYCIERDGSPATFLSEGEKSVISLLYFLKSLDAADCDRPNTVVVIDDPISSLDSNFTLGISSRIWSGLVGKISGIDKCRQLFLLTHSFELFRSWCNNLDRLDGPTRSREDITYLVQELRTRVVRNALGECVREPFFLPWPINEKFRKRIRSEYHFLFWRVADSLQKCRSEPSLENDLEVAAIMPNACRRLLEGFLSFRYPSEIGNFRNQLKAAIDDVKDAATRTRVLTFLNQYSHNEEGDTGKAIARPESVRILEAVFELIESVDPDHYVKMCAALDIDFSIISLVSETNHTPESTV